MALPWLVSAAALCGSDGAGSAAPAPLNQQYVIQEFHKRDSGDAAWCRSAESYRLQETRESHEDRAGKDDYGSVLVYLSSKKPTFLNVGIRVALE